MPEIADTHIESLKWAHDLGESAQSVVKIGEREVLMGCKTPVVTDLEKFGDAPYRIRANKEFVDIPSFAEYMDKFSGENTLLFGSLGGKSVTANIDYHGKGAPSWASHTAVLKSLVTAEWKALTAANGKWIKQQEFAEWLTEWNHIVVEPESAALAEIALNLEGSIDGKFAARINLSNGSRVMTFQEDVNTGNVRVPTKIHVACAPFWHSPIVDVCVQLQIRINEGKPIFRVVIQNPDRIEHEALLKTFADVKEKTGMGVLVGP
jgi:uncharacterized protein YfdQ (DUF2303 family)